MPCTLVFCIQNKILKLYIHNPTIIIKNNALCTFTCTTKIF